MPKCSIANIELQKTLACPFLHPLFHTCLEKEEAFCCCSGSLAMAAILALTKGEYRVMLVAFRPETECWTHPDTWLSCSLQRSAFKGVLQY